MNEIKKDAIKFFKLIGFIEICDENDLSAGPKEAIDVYNNIVIETEELAKKYEIYDEEKACSDPWYLLYTLWPQMKDFFLNKIYKGDDKMTSNIEQTTLSELKKLDENKIKVHFERNSTEDWIFDHDLQKWTYIPTGQTIKEYLLDNIELVLSPDMLKDFTSELIWHLNFDDVLDELTNMQLLSTITTQKQTDNGYLIYLIGEKVHITPKQWRKIVEKAVERFIRRDE